MQLLQAQGATYFPRTQEIRFDAPMMWLMAGLAISSALIFGLVPALHATGGSGDASLRSGRTVAGGAGVRRLRRSLVAAQFAIATPLLIVAALLLTSLERLRQVDLGFEASQLLTGSIRLPGALYSDNARVNAFWEQLQRRAEALPGVAAVAFADGLPPNTAGQHNNFDLEQYPAGPGKSQPVTPWLAVTPEYVRTLGLTLVEGRLLDERDPLLNQEAQNLRAVMVDRAWARRFFPNESAVGKRMRSGGCSTCPWTTVVGVVSDVKYDGIAQPNNGTVYTPLFGAPARFLLVRTEGDPLTIAASLQQVVREIEPAAPLSSVATMSALVDQSLARPQSLSLLVTSFAAVALAVVGDRNLRRDGLLRAAAPQGDQHPHGPRRQPVRRRAPRARPGHDGSRHRHCRRHRDSARGHAIDGEPAVQRRRVGSIGISVCRVPVVCGGGAGLRRSRVSRDATATSDGIEKRMTARF